MRIALITPSNLKYMPYLKNYIEVLDKLDVTYDVYNWDRLHIEDFNQNTHRSKKMSVRMNMWDYYLYSRFVKTKLSCNDYDRIIVFGFQLLFFFRRIMMKQFSGMYIVDIRDYNKIMRLFMVNKAIAKSKYAVISSPGFKEWLPTTFMKYILDHNIEKTDISKKSNSGNLRDISPVKIAYIGFVRDIGTNKALICSLGNSPNYDLVYNGSGSRLHELVDYAKDNDIKNVEFLGEYDPKDELDLYQSADMINCLMDKRSINSRTLLPNRFYRAVVKSKPIIALSGTCIATYVQMYNLGCIVNNVDEISSVLSSYIGCYDHSEYCKGRDKYLKKVAEEKELFQDIISKYVQYG